MSRANTHWCYVCSRAVQPLGRDMTCPNCNGGFVQELNELDDRLNPFDYLAVDSNDRHNNQFGIIDAFSALIRQRMGGSSRSLMSMVDPLPLHTSNGETELLFNGGTGVGMSRANLGHYFFGSGFEDFIEQLSRNNHHGPPPASQSAIDAMPIVKDQPEASSR
ncbi:unnamed protein product [Musa banksii]